MTKQSLRLPRFARNDRTSRARKDRTKDAQNDKRHRSQVDIQQPRLKELVGYAVL
jgi:hypothetical protein